MNMKKAILLLLLFCLTALSDTNTLTDWVTGNTITADRLNDIHEAIRGDFVGRNSSNAPTAGKNLGNSTYPWGPIYSNQLTNTHVCYVTSNGQIASEATLSKSRGGAGADMSSVTFPSSGTLVTETGSATLTNKTLTTPTLTTPQVNGLDLSIRTEVGTYTATATDDVILANGTFSVNLPAAASSTGKVFKIKNVGTGVITIDGNSSETIDGATTFKIHAQYEEATISCDGSNWHVIGYSPVAGTYTPTLTGVTNYGSATAFACQYSKIKTIVTVSCRVNSDPTSAAASTQLGVTLPIASNFTTTEDASGACTASDDSTRCYVGADTSNDRIQLEMIPAVNTNHGVFFTFQYEIK